MSKLLLNLLTQISKALVYSKIKFLFEKKIFLHFWPIRSFGPAATHSLFLFFSTGHPLSPLGLGLSAGPAHPHSRTGRLLPAHTPEPSAQAATAGRPHAAPRSTPMTSTGRKIMAASLLLHSPIKRCHFPSSIPSNRHLQSGGIEASSTTAIEGTRPPPPHLRPIKGRPALGEDSHTSNAPPLSPQRALATALPSRGCTAGETPLHASRTMATPSLNSPAHLCPPPPLGQSSRAPERPEAELR
jgi:hypothetical protein